MYNYILIIMFSVLTFIMGAIQIVLTMRMKKKALLFPLAIFIIASLTALIYLFPLRQESYEILIFFAFNMPSFLLVFLHFATKLVLKFRKRSDEEAEEIEVANE